MLDLQKWRVVDESGWTASLHPSWAKRHSGIACQCGRHTRKLMAVDRLEVVDHGEWKQPLFTVTHMVAHGVLTIPALLRELAEALANRDDRLLLLDVWCEGVHRKSHAFVVCEPADQCDPIPARLNEPEHRCSGCRRMQRIGSPPYHISRDLAEFSARLSRDGDLVVDRVARAVLKGCRRLSLEELVID